MANDVDGDCAGKEEGDDGGDLDWDGMVVVVLALGTTTSSSSSSSSSKKEAGLGTDRR